MKAIILIFAALLILYLLFRKKKVRKPVKMESDFKALLQQHVEYYQKLSEAKRTDFLSCISYFLDETRIEGVGIQVSDLDKVLIAASAVIPIFGFPGWKYKNLSSVILYPDTFDEAFQYEGGERRISGMVGNRYMNGQMILSRAALLKGFSKNSGKENTAIHEFVHLLDKSDGSTDGVPEILMAHEYTVPWLKMIHQEMHRIEKGKSDINPYAMTNEAEFLAVASEYFFEKPEQLRKKHPELYKMMSGMFMQDPVS